MAGIIDAPSPMPRTNIETLRTQLGGEGTELGEVDGFPAQHDEEPVTTTLR